MRAVQSRFLVALISGSARVLPGELKKLWVDKSRGRNVIPQDVWTECVRLFRWPATWPLRDSHPTSFSWFCALSSEHPFIKCLSPSSLTGSPVVSHLPVHTSVSHPFILSCTLTSQPNAHTLFPPSPSSGSSCLHLFWPQLLTLLSHPQDSSQSEI